MGNGKLRVKRVRRYRGAKYPSRHREAKRSTTMGRRVLRGAAVPAVALGLGAVGGACDGGLNLAGTEPDAADAVETTVDAGHDATPPEDAGPADVALEEFAMDASEPEGLNGDMPAGTHYLRYLGEAEGRAIIQDAIVEAAGEPDPPCLPLTLADRLVEDAPFARDGAAPIDANVDLFAEPWVPPCERGELPAVGFEWATDEAGDDEDVSGDPAGFRDDEETALRALRESREAGIAVLHAADYAYNVWEYEGGYVDDSDRARAEATLREDVRTIVDDLRRDGMI